jgi:hypothetical protein
MTYCCARESPETHINRQATQYGCLPSLLGDRDQGMEIVYGGEKAGPTRAVKVEKYLFSRHDMPKEPTKERPVLFVPTHLSFNSQQGPSLSSLSGCPTTVEILVTVPTHFITHCTGIPLDFRFKLMFFAFM